jgi:hypothetical protein
MICRIGSHRADDQASGCSILLMFSIQLTFNASFTLDTSNQVDLSFAFDTSNQFMLSAKIKTSFKEENEKFS